MAYKTSSPFWGKPFATFAILALTICAMGGVVMISENSDAANDVIITSSESSYYDPTAGTSSNPYTDLSRFRNTDDVITNGINPAALKNDIYVLVGAPVKTLGVGTAGTIMQGIGSVSSGFGLTVTEQSAISQYVPGTGTLSGTISKAGDISISVVIVGQTTGFENIGSTVVIHAVEPSTPVTSISISGSSSGEVGDSITLTATTSPSSATDRTVTWSITSGSSRASITSQTDTSTGGRCVISLESAGSVTVKATANDGSGVSKTKTITISNPEYTCYVKYNANGGSGAPSQQSYTGTSTSNHTFTISSNIPVKSGFVFKGWATTNGGLVQYQPGSTVSVSYNGTTTLYAIFESAQLDITTTPDSTSVTVGKTFSYTVGASIDGCTVSVSGASWLSVSGNVISGTPTVAGTYDVTVTISKSGGYTSDSQSFTITVYSSMGFTSEPGFDGIYAYVE